MVALGFCHCASGQDVEIVMPSFANLITESGDGLYQQLFYEAADRIDLSYTVRHYPPARAWQYFPEHEDACLLAYYDVMESELGKDSVVPAYPFGVAKTYIFSPRGQPVISSVDELEGKTIGGLLFGDPYYGSLISKGVSIDYTSSQELLIEKIRAGRVDLILGAMPDFVPLLGDLDYDPDYVVHIFFDQMVCHNNALGRSVAERISGALEAMKSEGVTQIIMGSQFIDFEY